ncbi:MAG: HU family DNA-binding protein [Oscillospiraceae bacterium]|nr:HU family DNA-binding protein [Oscillospiraceae bacterium]
MIYKQKDLVKMVAAESGYYQGAVKDIYNATSAVITKILSESTPEDLVTIKLFEGLSIETKFYKGKETVKPRTGEKTISDDHIYPRAKFTQAYQLKIRSACNGEDEE